MNERLMAAAVRRQVDGGRPATLATTLISQTGGAMQADDQPAKQLRAYLYGSVGAPRVDPAVAGRLELSAGMFALVGPEAGPVATGSAARTTLDLGGGERYRVVDAKALAPHQTVLGYVLALQTAQ